MSLTTSTQELAARENLDPLEEARACWTLVHEFGLTQEQVAQRVGRSRSGVANLMRLLNLSEEILELIRRGKLKETHGLALLRVKDPETRGALARAAVGEGWSVPALQARADQSNEALRGPRDVVRQAALLAWTAGLGAITAEALAERDQMTIASASERLDEAVQSGLLDRHAILVGYSVLHTATRAGQSLARKHAAAGGYRSPKGLRTARLPIATARHTIACAGVAATLERRYPDCRVIGERELRRDEHEQGRRLATLKLRGSANRQSHSPDIVIWPPPIPGERPPLPVAVEVELSLKSRADLTENCRAWARCPYVEAVIYFAETRKIEEQLLDVIDELRAEEMIVVNPLSEILEPQPGFQLSE
jgi:transcriptional regulator with XRE-family HTH domain/DNA-binding MarR family transcriptional regulator